MSEQEFTGHVRAMRADSEFFGAEDLMGLGDVPFQVVKVMRYENRKACGKLQKEMFTLRLATDKGEAKKEFWIKPTNRKTLVKLYGANVKEWKGKYVWFYVTEVNSPQGGQTLGIRIRERTDAPNWARKQQATEEAST